jgi:flavin reductase (DIM6/NTAB) family NADH-FMN oxidoreductase RutF
MFYEPHLRNHGLPHDPFKAIVAPRPIGWISSVNAAGAVNLSPYSFFNAISDHPHMVCFSSAGIKDALAFAEETGEFVCSIATFEQRNGMNVSSAPFPRGVSEFEPAGLEMAPSRLVKPPRVAGAPASLECKWLKSIDLVPLEGGTASYRLAVGQVIGIHIEDRFIDAKGMVDTAAMRIIARGGYHDYFVADSRFSLARPTRV